MTRWAPVRSALALAVVAIASGCRDESTATTVASSASCAPAVVYDGHLYLGHHVAKPPAEGEPLGDGTLPRCDDTGEMTSSPPEDVSLAELEGVSASVAVLRRDDEDSVYVRQGVPRSTLPRGLLEAVRPLTCLPANEPIRFVAEMRGIAPARPGRPFDLAPFDLWVRILQSSSLRYERGSVRVRVPEPLGRPLSRADVDAAWNGARLLLDIHCLNSGYVADRVALRRS